jgi:phosphatidylglycerol:prolipoprotein diacylglycerol transferase
MRVMDVCVLIAGPGIFLGRCANFINGELLGAMVGKPGEKGPWWSVKFPHEVLGWSSPGVRGGDGAHTPDLSAAQEGKLWLLAQGEARAGETLATGLRRMVENPGRYAAEWGELLAPRHPSQLYQAVAEGVVCTLVVWWLARPAAGGAGASLGAGGRAPLRLRPGSVMAAWLIAYGVLRIVTEVWRLPDAQFVGASARPWGLSRGQWLSVPMIGAGVAALAWNAARGGRSTQGVR